jgi:hypothetical protein
MDAAGGDAAEPDASQPAGQRTHLAHLGLYCRLLLRNPARGSAAPVRSTTVRPSRLAMPEPRQHHRAAASPGDAASKMSRRGRRGEVFIRPGRGVGCVRGGGVRVTSTTGARLAPARPADGTSPQMNNCADCCTILGGLGMPRVWRTILAPREDGDVGLLAPGLHVDRRLQAPAGRGRAREGGGRGGAGLSCYN